jgi:hypothetical protein
MLEVIPRAIPAHYAGRSRVSLEKQTKNSELNDVSAILFLNAPFKSVTCDASLQHLSLIRESPHSSTKSFSYSCQKCCLLIFSYDSRKFIQIHDTSNRRFARSAIWIQCLSGICCKQPIKIQFRKSPSGNSTLYYVSLRSTRNRPSAYAPHKSTTLPRALRPRLSLPRLAERSPLYPPHHHLLPRII